MKQFYMQWSWQKYCWCIQCVLSTVGTIREIRATLVKDLWEKTGNQQREGGEKRSGQKRTELQVSVSGTEMLHLMCRC